MVDPQAHAVLAFWFETLRPAQWFRRDPALDETIRRRFGDTLAAARRGELAAWRQSPRGRLAEVIVLDQFSRHVHRDTAEAFAADGQALALAREAVATGDDAALTARERAFLYMPYMHSESPAVHEEARALFEGLGLADSLRAERRHADIIARFGRYPHRNAALGRDTTEAERAFLTRPGSSF